MILVELLIIAFIIFALSLCQLISIASDNDNTQKCNIDKWKKNHTWKILAKICEFQRATLYFEEVQFRPSRKPVLWVTSRLWNGGTWIVCVWGFKAVGSPLTAAQWPQLSNDLIEQTLRLRSEIRTSTETLCRDPNFVFR